MRELDRLVEGLLSALRARLPGMVAAAGLPPLQGWLTWQPQPPLASQAPQIWVVLQGARPGGPAALGGPSGAETMLLSLRIGLSAAAPDPGLATSRLYRLAELARAAALVDRTIGGAASDLRWTGTLWPPERGEAQHLLRTAAIELEATQWRRLDER